MTTRQPGHHAAQRSDHAAVVMAGTDTTVTYAELEASSNRVAHLLRSHGLGAGAHVAVLLPNHHRYFEVVWAGLRAGMYVTPINWHLGPEEAGYIIEDCDAEVLITSARFADVVSAFGSHLAAVRVRLVVDGDLDGFTRLDDAVSGLPDTPIPDETEGAWMFYSSGTTGRPKGIMPPLSGAPFGTGGALDQMMEAFYGFGDESRYLCPAPLYHAAPLGWSMSAQRLGATVVVMERFDAEQTLATIERERITHAQFVPTHFIRMLKLPDAVRDRYDISSLQTVIHAAAPCPVEVKHRMLDWWGPIIHEYYAGSEGGGFCAVGPDEWLAHPGTVGKPLLGAIHIVGEDDRELPPGEVGQIWFESGATYEYHKDPAKTAEAFNERGWSTLGDVGYLDEAGYLFLTDRVSHMIISGGVNIYPQEIEDALSLHPAVVDVAVIGVPDAEMGEQVKAVVQPADPAVDTEALERELIAHCRDQLAHYKCPRTVDFRAALPRLPTGKLLKRKLRDEYAAGDRAPAQEG